MIHLSEPRSTLRYGMVIWLRNLLAVLIFGLSTLTSTAEQRMTVALLGDSLTHGYGLPPSEGFVQQLQAWLDANDGRPVTLINAGVSGDTTAGGLARLDWTLTPEVDAIVVELGGNDILRAIEPSVARDNLDQLLAKVSERGLPALLAGIAVPGNYGPEYRTEFLAIYPTLAKKYQTLLYPNFFEAISAVTDQPTATGHMQSDGIHPSAKGVALIVEDIGPLVRQLIDRIDG